MRNLIFSILCIFFVTSVYSQTGLRLGLSGSYATEINKVGVKAHVGYAYDNNILLLGNYTFYASSDGGSGTISASILNFNFGWRFIEINNKLGLYPLAGLNVGFYPRTGDSLQTRFGANLGVGADYELLPWLYWNSQIKYVISKYDYLEISTGLHVDF